MRVLVGLLFILACGPVRADTSDLIEFLQPNGCAIGPATLAFAQDKRIDPQRLLSFSLAALSDGTATRHGFWVVLSKDICQITMPLITSPLKLSDPDIATLVTPIDAYIEFEEHGCFLNVVDHLDDIAAGRGWTIEQASRAYYKMIGAGIVSGDMAFFSDSPLKTPPGLQVLTGTCAEVPQIAEIRADQAVLRDIFGAYLRATQQLVLCEQGASMMHPESYQILEGLAGRPLTNAWLAFEVSIIALGAGWIEGATHREKGTPRPPLCHTP